MATPTPGIKPGSGQVIIRKAPRREPTPTGTPVPATPADFAASCQKSSEKQWSSPPPTIIDPARSYTATIRTEKGDIVVDLLPNVAPVTVNNFVFLACKGFYDGVTFHRVIAGFVAQGGDPTGTGTGGPGYTIPDEFSSQPFDQGHWGWLRPAAPTAAAASSSFATGCAAEPERQVHRLRQGDGRHGRGGQADAARSVNEPERAAGRQDSRDNRSGALGLGSLRTLSSWARAKTVSRDYEARLAGLAPSLPQDLRDAAPAVAAHLSGDDFGRWVEEGVALAGQSLRSWEAACEYFRAGPPVVRLLPFDCVLRWAHLGRDIADQSSVVAAAYFRASPESVGLLSPEELEQWAAAGQRLYQGNWKSISLAALFFAVSPALLPIRRPPGAAQPADAGGAAGGALLRARRQLSGDRAGRLLPHRAAGPGAVPRACRTR